MRLLASTIGLLALLDGAAATAQGVQVTAAPPPAFDSQTPPPAPDFQMDSAWAALPGVASAADTVPSGRKQDSNRHDVDVFYIHPTTYRTPDRWNADPSDAKLNAWTDSSVIARQAAVFNVCCNIFAPRYRQASLLATRDRFMDGDGGKAYALAYSDVLRAFDQWQASRNQGRPFILAGHSQGGEMIARLLADRIDGTPLQGRMIAAYAIGIDLSNGYFGRRYRTLKPCDTPTRTGCVLGWNVVSPDADLKMLGGFAGSRYARFYGTEEGRESLCINPLTFDLGKPAAPRQASKGAVPGDPGLGPVRALVAGKFSARCERGFLVADTDPSLELKPMQGGIMHYHDYGLFYADIQANVIQRIRAWKRTKS